MAWSPQPRHRGKRSFGREATREKATEARAAWKVRVVVGYVLSIKVGMCWVDLDLEDR